MVWYGVVWYGMLWYCAVLYDMVQFVRVGQSSTAQDRGELIAVESIKS